MNQINKNIVVRYLVITFAITCFAWGILAILTNLNILNSSDLLYKIFHIIGGFGPTIGAIMVLPDKSLDNIKEFIFSYKKNSVWVLILFCVLYALVIGLSSSGINPEIPWFATIFIFLMTTFIGGGNEELGWRGIMQPELEKKYSFPIATLITAFFWVIWHAPLWFIDGMSQQNANFFAFFAYGLLLSFWLASIYEKTESVFFCMIFHGLSNFLMSYFKVEVNLIYIVGIMGLLAFSIWFYYKDIETNEL